MSFNRQTRSLGCISQPKKEHTTTKVFSDVEKRWLRSIKHTQGEVRERIATIITAPNKSWAKRRKHKKYTLSRSFFGQYAWLRLIIRYAVVWHSMTLEVLQRYSHFYFVDFQTSCTPIWTSLIFFTKLWCNFFLCTPVPVGTSMSIETNTRNLPPSLRRLVCQPTCSYSRVL